jgi:hypothetical protein
MPQSETKDRIAFLESIISENAGAYSRDFLQELQDELKMLRRFSEDFGGEESDRDPDFLAKEIAEPNPKSTDMGIDGSKFHS